MADSIDEPSSSRPSNPAAKEKKGITLSATQIVAIILLILVVIFIFENTRKVKIRFIFGAEHNIPVWMALFGAAVLGALIGALLSYRRKHKKQS